MGSICKRVKIWWIKYSRNGKPYYESSKSTKETDAKRLLKKREGEIVEGKLPGIIFDRVRFEELAEDYLTDLKFKQRKSIWRSEIIIEHLQKHFRGLRVTEITTARIKADINARVEEGKTNATINRELSALKRMLNLGAKCSPPKVAQIPYIPKLKGQGIRQGFLEHQTYEAILGALPYLPETRFNLCLLYRLAQG